MIKTIISTTGSRVFVAIIGLLVVILNSRILGAEGVGNISLIVLGVTIIIMVNNLVGGGALIYLVPRFDVFKLLAVSYLWGLLTAFVCSILMSVFNLVPESYEHHLFFLSLIFSLANANLMILIGKEKMNRYNIATVVQMLCMAISLCVFFFIAELKEVRAYVYSLYVSYFILFVISIFWVIPYVSFSGMQGYREIIKNIFKYGAFTQAANIMQLLNYRLSYYLISFFSGSAALGIYTVGVQISEGLWLPGKSISLVQYARLSNVDDIAYSKKVTLSLLKFVFVVTLLLLLALLMVPGKVFALIFGPEFYSVNIVILALAVGILALSISIILSSFFSGMGKHQINTIGSGIGLLFTLGIGLWLIPRYGFVGAGLTASMAYLASAIQQVYMFFKIAKPTVRDFFIKKEDVDYVRNLFFKGKNESLPNATHLP